MWAINMLTDKRSFGESQYLQRRKLMSVSNVGGGNYQPLAPVEKPVQKNQPLAPEAKSDLTPAPSQSNSSVDIVV